MTERGLPMFPLQSVLVPAAPLSLHVFESRYRALVNDVLSATPPEFGVVLIERGSEVGGGDVRSHVGTVARVVQAEQSPDGRWGVVAIGTRRIDVIEWLPDDPYPIAVVVDRPDGRWTEEAGSLAGSVEPLVRRCLALKAELGENAPPATVELDDDLVTRAWQLLAVAPLTAIDRHRLLAIDDPAERLLRLQALVEDEASVLAQRMSGL